MARYQVHVLVCVVKALCKSNRIHSEKDRLKQWLYASRTWETEGMCVYKAVSHQDITRRSCCKPGCHKYNHDALLHMEQGWVSIPRAGLKPGNMLSFESKHCNYARAVLIFQMIILYASYYDSIRCLPVTWIRPTCLLPSINAGDTRVHL